MQRTGHPRYRRLARLALAPLVLLALAWLIMRDSSEAVADAPIDVTADAVQRFYQDGVPQIDRSGKATTGPYSDTSVFPRGIYYPELCRAERSFAWPAFTDTAHPNWQQFANAGQTYDVFITLGSTLPTSPQDRITIYAATHAGLATTVEGLPADQPLIVRVYPHPWPYFYFAPGPVYQESFSVGCSPTDQDLPNVVQPLAEANFNVAVIKSPFHPQPYIDLKKSAGAVADRFQFVIDAREPRYYEYDLKGFAEQLFAPPEQGGQGYATHPDILGWQLDDEPLSRIGARKGCTADAMLGAIDLLRSKYQAHQDLTDQVLFHIEAGYTMFACSRAWWPASVYLGDAANHFDYLSQYADPGTLKVIADSVSAQTNVGGQRRPSWFTTQAFSDRLREQGFPPAQQTRATAYTAIVHGATGIWYFMLDGATARNADMTGIRPTIPPSYSEQLQEWQPSDATRAQGEQLWDAVSRLNGELAALAPVLLSPTSREDYRVFIKQQTYPWSPVRTMLKSVGNLRYLIAVNIDAKPVDAQFAFSDRLSASEVLFEEGHTPPVTGSLLSDHFEPFDVHVYRLQLIDTDTDGVHDSIDNCPSAANAEQHDADGDGAGDPCDDDDDNDGAPDLLDNCPLVANGDQHDADGDGAGDACDDDDDNDGAADPLDNCPLVANADQLDADGDGLGALCDPSDSVADADRDGCTDTAELSSNPLGGGRRDPLNFWDFFDAPNRANVRDRVVSLSDIAYVIQRFGQTGPPLADPLSLPPPPPAYHTAYDRGAPIGPYPWSRGPADGVIALVDVVVAISQFGHSCVEP